MRSSKYLKFIRQFDCCWCHATENIEAHHFGRGGTGFKCSDLETVPLCHKCHMEFHQQGHLGSPGSALKLTPRETKAYFHEKAVYFLGQFIRGQFGGVADPLVGKGS